MSKIREQVPEFPEEGQGEGQAEDRAEGDVRADAGGDLTAFVVFTQLKAGGPHVYAGWLDAPDEEMALSFAREHYGQDQECTGIWVARREDVAGLHVGGPPAEALPGGTYRIFVERDAGEPYVSAETVEADGPEAALAAARATRTGEPAAHGLWAIPADRLASTAPGDLIWRRTDQSYRLARGYSRSVREKWERIRERGALEEYEKDDLQEAF